MAVIALVITEGNRDDNSGEEEEGSVKPMIKANHLFICFIVRE